MKALSIRTKLALAVIALLAGAAAFTYAYVPSTVRRLSARALDNKARSIAAMTAYSLAPALVFNDRREVEELMAAAGQDSDVVAVRVYDDRSNLFAELKTALRPAAGGVLRADAPVVFNGRKIGRVALEVARTAVERDVRRGRAWAATLSAVIFVLGTGASLLISTLFTRPLGRMVEVTEDISRGNLHRRADADRGDEVGTLARSFNRMVESLQAAQRELAEVNQGLEGKVAERTRQLQAEVEERRRAEETLRRSETRYRTLFETSGEAILILDETGKVADANLAAETLLGVPLAELAGAALSGFVVETDELAESLEWARKGETVREAAITVRSRGEGQRHCLLTVTALRLGDSEPRLFQGVIRDITERRQLETQLMQAQKMEAVGQLAGGVAHDFNNLLTVITGNLEMVMMDLPEGDPIRRELTEIGRAAQRAGDLTRQLLAFSRRQALDPRVVNLGVILRDMERMLRRLIGENIDYRTVIPDDLGNVRVDPGMMEQVIANLVVNARDAMPDGGRLTVETANVVLSEEYRQTHPAVPPGEYVMLAVSDTGIGMSPEVRSRLFQPFFTTKGVGKGTGLGLSTVYGIVKQSGGFIWVYSEEGRGTTFKIYLPLVREKTEPLRARTEEAGMPRGTETVMVVEDEPGVRELAVRVLRQLGYQVLEAANGAEGYDLARARGRAVDLLLTDVVMPNLSGIELARQLREIWPDLKTLYMSGYADAAAYGGTLARGEPYLQKPFAPAKLAQMVRNVLDGRV